MASGGTPERLQNQGPDLGLKAFALLALDTVLGALAGRPAAAGPTPLGGKAEDLPGCAKRHQAVHHQAAASVIADWAVQAWVLRQNGIALAAIELAHIDTAFVYQGDGNYHGLLHHALLDAEVYPLVEHVSGWVQAARGTLTGDGPDIKPGAHCDDPFECPFKAHCSRAMVQPALPAYSLDVFARMRASIKARFAPPGFRGRA
jgi:hypothetical protein